VVDRAASQRRVRAIFEELPGADRQQQDALKAELAEIHTPLILHIARRFADRGEPFDDLVQVGMLAFVRAVDRFEPGRDIEFSTYLTPTVMGEIKRHFRDHGWTVKVPRRAQELHALISRATQEFLQTHGRNPSVRELTEVLDLTEAEVLTGLEAQHAYSALPIDVPVSGDAPTIADRLPDGSDPYDQVEWHAVLAGLIGELPVREQRILKMRFNDEMTQAQIAAELGVSQMHVSRLLARALAYLRTSLSPPA
jgi:RNA polymerase sigma-B factor